MKAVVREIIRHSIPIEVLVPPLDGSFNADQLIGAGLVREAQAAYVGFEIYGLANRFRAAVEAGILKVRDMDEAGYLLALQAGAAGLAFAALPPGFLPRTGSIPGVASANEVDYRPVLCPFTGRQEMLVRAIAPDVAIIHCQFVDADGNCGFLGAPFLDLEMARAGAKCLVQAEQQVDVLPAACRAHLPAYAVDAWCIVPGGAHPGSSHGLYQYDGEHLADYAQASRTSAGFAVVSDRTTANGSSTPRNFRRSRIWFTT